MSMLFARPSQRYKRDVLLTALFAAFFLVYSFLAHATVASVAVQSPTLSVTGTSNVTSPVHFQATAESDSKVTGYVIYVDGQNVYQNFVPSLDTWVVLAPGTTHTVFVKAWDSTGSLASSPTYSINVTGLVMPTPPSNAKRIVKMDRFTSWVVDNNPDVGGQCNDGSIGQYQSAADPNTENAPDFATSGQHFLVTSKCQYDDSLFHLSDKTSPSPYVGDTNFLWDFWFYVPSTVQDEWIQALEFDLYQAVQLNNGVHEFMFGSQCNYATNQWQIWLPQNSSLTWVNAGLSPCKFTTGAWHHVTYFLQRVTTAGYQIIPASFSPSTDTNTNLRFGTLTVDGNTMYLGGLAFSTIPSPPWAQVLGVQHQLDSAASGVTIEEYANGESLTVW